MEIRDIRQKDRAGIRRLVLEVYRENSLAMWYDSEPAPDELDRLFEVKMGALGLNGAIDVVALDGKRVVGECEIVSMGSYGKLGVLVSRDCRGRGVGSALLSAAMGKCHGIGISRVVVEVVGANSGAIAFFKARGFEPAGISADSVTRKGMRYDVVYMQKEISG